MVTEDQQDNEGNQDLLVHQALWVCQDHRDLRAREDREVSREDLEVQEEPVAQVCLDNLDPEENQVQTAFPDRQVCALVSTPFFSFLCIF